MTEAPKFLHSVASHILKTGQDLGRLTLVFPNKRAAIFFRYYLKGLTPCTSPLPETMTMSAFLEGMNDSDLVEADNVELMFILYRAYCKVFERRGLEPRSFDRFAFWGDMMLADFNDIDSALADPSKVYANLERLKEISANYLSDEQLEVIREIWGEDIANEMKAQDTDTFWKHINYEDTEGMSQKFVRLWQTLGDIYTQFNKDLAERGLAYGGMIQRRVSERVQEMGSKNFGFGRVAFVGFSQMSYAVIRILRRLRKLGIADFYWDLLPESHHFAGDAGRTVAALAKHFGQAEDFESPVSEMPRVETLSVPSNFLQAKAAGAQLKDWHDSHCMNCTRPDNTAVILPDPFMLPAILHSLPEDIGEVNITMGLQYRQTPFAALMRTLTSMHLRSRTIHGSQTFFYEDLNSLICNTQLQTLMPSACAVLRAYLRKNKAYNIPAEQLRNIAGAEAMAPFFAEIADGDKPEQVQAYLDGVFGAVAQAEKCRADEISNSKTKATAGIKPGNTIEEKILEAYNNATQRIFECIQRYNIKQIGEGRLLGMIEKLLTTNMLHMKGMPLSGMQVMGILETRALDFDNVMILSMNERVFPRRSYQRTFIPQILRRAYGLPTSDDSERETAYQFYRLLNRSKQVFCLYDGRMSGLKAAGKSRYLIQLENLTAPGAVSSSQLALSTIGCKERVIDVEKDEHVQTQLSKFKDKNCQFNISASALKKYHKCPLMFYLDCVCKLNSDNDPTEYIDPATYGNVLHEVLEETFNAMRTSPSTEVKVSSDMIKAVYENRDALLEHVKRVLDANQHHGRYAGNLSAMPGESQLVADMICDYVVEILQFEADRCVYQPFTFIDSEHSLVSTGKRQNTTQWRASANNTINVRLDIDRLDRLEDGTLRFVDYKTGRDSNHVDSIVALFDSNPEKGNDAIFQLLFYAMLYNDLKGFKGNIEPQLYRIPSIFVNNPHAVPNSKQFVSNISEASLDKQKLFGYIGIYAGNNQLKWTGGEPSEWMEDFRKLVGEMIDEIFNPDVPFKQCENDKSCTYCAYVNLCRRLPETTKY